MHHVDESDAGPPADTQTHKPSCEAVGQPAETTSGGLVITYSAPRQVPRYGSGAGRVDDGPPACAVDRVASTVHDDGTICAACRPTCFALRDAARLLDGDRFCVVPSPPHALEVSSVNGVATRGENLDAPTVVTPFVFTVPHDVYVPGFRRAVIVAALLRAAANECGVVRVSVACGVGFEFEGYARSVDDVRAVLNATVAALLTVARFATERTADPPDDVCNAPLGRKTGPWTDVHAMALVLTEILVGGPAYRAKNSQMLLAETLDQIRPTPKKLGLDVGSWEPVIACALKFDAAERYPNAELC